jgi:hypothetical protein
MNSTNASPYAQYLATRSRLGTVVVEDIITTLRWQARRDAVCFTTVARALGLSLEDVAMVACWNQSLYLA